MRQSNLFIFAAPRLNDNYLRESEVLPLRIGDDLLLSFVPGSDLAKKYALDY
jgi:hypothetical protein